MQSTSVHSAVTIDLVASHDRCYCSRANGMANGQGTRHWLVLVDGKWKEDRHNEGWIKSRTGGLKLANGDRYDGNWEDGQRSGQGVLTYASGTRYEGDWKDGESDGQGVIIWTTGDRCNGTFRSGILIGTGEGRFNRRDTSCHWGGLKYMFD